MVTTVARLRLSEGWAATGHHLCSESLDGVGRMVHGEDVASVTIRVLSTWATSILV